VRRRTARAKRAVRELVGIDRLGRRKGGSAGNGPGAVRLAGATRRFDSRTSGGRARGDGCLVGASAAARRDLSPFGGGTPQGGIRHAALQSPHGGGRASDPRSRYIATATLDQFRESCASRSSTAPFETTSPGPSGWRPSSRSSSPTRRSSFAPGQVVDSRCRKTARRSSRSRSSGVMRSRERSYDCCARYTDRRSRRI
jgi:hypothetical protein